MAKKPITSSEYSYGQYQKLCDDATGGSPGIVKGNYYSNVDPNISVKPPFYRSDYEYFRPDENIPQAISQENYRQIMVKCNNAYKRVGIIRSVIDLMAEFAVKGLEIVSEDDGPNKFWHAWFAKVNMDDRSERFASWLLRGGNAVVRRVFGQLTINQINVMKRQNVLAADLPNNNQLGRIPVQYILYDPATIELVGGYAGALSEKKIYAIRIPSNSLTGVGNPKNDLEKKVFDALTPELKKVILSKPTVGQTYLVELPSDKLYVGHYKKDDSEIWAIPLIYAILADVNYNDKLKMAKTAGLDGFYSPIRLWKLGDHKEKHYASPAQFSRLAGILQQNTGGGAADILWGSDISLDDHYPPLDKLQNFEENNEAILIGLGISSSLAGGESKDTPAGGIMGLKNVMTRIEPVRRAIKDWLNAEIDIVQANMGFKKRPHIRFTYEDLQNEQTYYKMLVDLVDRNIISDRTVLERFHEIPDVENKRVKEQEEGRNSDALPDKASPFHNPNLPLQQDHELKKIKLTDKLAGEQGNNSSNMSKEARKPTNNGRPPGKKDSFRRKRGVNRGSSIAKLMIDGGVLYDKLSDFLTNKTLAEYNVKDVRSLTMDQRTLLDKSRMFLFPRLDPNTDISEDNIYRALELNSDINNEYNEIYNQLIGDASVEKLSEEQKRMLRITAYADLGYYNLGNDNENI